MRAWQICLASGLILTSAAIACAQAATRLTPDNGSRPPGFGTLQGQRAVPGFGVGADSLIRPLPEDLARANERLQQYDRNRDGFLDRGEMQGGRWYDDPAVYDADRDGRLTAVELAQRYARRRVDEAAGRLPPWQSSRSGTSSSASPGQDRERQERERRAREEAQRRSSSRVTRESWHLAETLVSRHDLNRDGELDLRERRNMGVISGAVDADRNGRLNRNELAEWLAELEANQLRRTPREMPSWFAERDADGDGQVSMSEFADEWTDDRLDEFIRLDTSEDGMLVPEEVLAAMERLRSEHANQEFQIIPTRGIVRAEIEVEEHAVIADLDVQLSITHTHDEHLNVFLIGPEGERVELFTGVGGNDDHFDGTILDDESPAPIVRARPPFSGRYQTEARSKGQPGLRQFNGRSMAGKWGLFIEAQSDRPGALHGWALIFRTLEEPTDTEGAPAGADDFD